MPNFLGAGFLGPRYQPLAVPNPQPGVDNLRSYVSDSQFNSRVALLDELEQGFLHTHPSAHPAAAHHTAVRRAVALMRDRGTRAFDLTTEPQSVRASYGGAPFGASCLLARRLIEVGVRFVEVHLDGWDTHDTNFERVRRLSGQVDPAMSQLVRDLHDRGLLATVCRILGVDHEKQNPAPNGRPIRIVDRPANSIRELL